MPRHRRHTSRLYRRQGSPYWWAEYSTAQGSVVRQSTGCRENGAAREWLAARTLERVREEAGIPQARRISLLQALAEYQEAREPLWSRGWAITVDGFFRHRVVPWFGGDRMLSGIGRPAVESFRVGQIGRPGQRGKTSGAATVNRCMAALAAFGAWASDPERAYLLTNPFAKHRPLPEDVREILVLTEAELARFLAKVPETTHGGGGSYPLRAIVSLAVETGLRKGELGRLRWEDVDLDGRRLVVVSSWARGLTKGKKTREQALTSRAVETLRALGAQPSGPVFGPIGDHRRALQGAAEAVGLETFWFHAARHVGASRFAAAGATGHELKQWGGWASGRMADRYTHADHRRLLALADRVDEKSGQPAHSATSSPKLTPENSAISVDPTGIEPVTS